MERHLDLRGLIWGAVQREREHQDRKWGVASHPDVRWLGILMEEVGELAKEVIEDGPVEPRVSELIQVMTVCMAWLEITYREEAHAGLRGHRQAVEEQGNPV